MALWLTIKDFLQRHQVIARVGLWIGVVSGVVGIVATFATNWAEKERADDLIREVLGQSRAAAAPGFRFVNISSGPSSAFMSATNVLANGELSDNESLIRAAEVLNDAYSKLADCYRSRNCGKAPSSSDCASKCRRRTIPFVASTP